MYRMCNSAIQDFEFALHADDTLVKATGGQRGIEIVGHESTQTISKVT